MKHISGVSKEVPKKAIGIAGFNEKGDIALWLANQILPGSTPGKSGA